MFIAHVEFRVTDSERDAALKVLINEAATVRGMPGNLKFQAFLNPEQPNTIEIMHEWQSEEGFTAYLASDSFASVGAALGPQMLAPPVSKRFIANPVDA
ncbi:putative quinol monooxygenase [Cognatishimia activa]|uniref:putative quinol monooxygenase n=1 Tax=Cognatishimia activa TaxID=1715691 RepID=UPI00222FA29A|nr:putative quinol monooxygenase [Cognatishimia activa]UZD89977.1 antibiotic biosynthesis monooxygenase [Cognatishimia activa]